MLDDGTAGVHDGGFQGFGVERVSFLQGHRFIEEARGSNLSLPQIPYIDRLIENDRGFRGIYHFAFPPITPEAKVHVPMAKYKTWLFAENVIPVRYIKNW